MTIISHGLSCCHLDPMMTHPLTLLSPLHRFHPLPAGPATAPSAATAPSYSPSAHHSPTACQPCHSPLSCYSPLLQPRSTPFTHLVLTCCPPYLLQPPATATIHPYSVGMCLLYLLLPPWLVPLGGGGRCCWPCGWLPPHGHPVVKMVPADTSRCPHPWDGGSGEHGQVRGAEQGEGCIGR